MYDVLHEMIFIKIVIVTEDSADRFFRLTLIIFKEQGEFLAI